MAIEKELKFALQQQAIPCILQQISSYSSALATTYELTNDYYDTPQNELRQHDIGLRVRGFPQGYEMTLKGKKQSIAGIQQRPEFNIPLSSATLDITQFPLSVWPVELDLQQLQRTLYPIFNTHFQREAWRIPYQDCSIEVVLDQGEVIYGNNRLPILELELELVTGNQLTTLLEFTQQLLCDGMCLSDESKAARGYRLAMRLPTSNIEIGTLVQQLKNEQPLVRLQKLLVLWQRMDDQALQSPKQTAVQSVKEIIQAIQVVLPNLFLGFSLAQQEDLKSLQINLIQQLQQLQTLNDLKQCCMMVSYQRAKLKLLKIAAVT